MEYKEPTDQQVIDWLKGVNNSEVAVKMGLDNAQQFSRMKSGSYGISKTMRFAIWAYWVIWGGPDWFDRTVAMEVKGEIKKG